MLDDALKRLQRAAQNEATCLALRTALRDRDAEIARLQALLRDREAEIARLREGVTS